MILMATWKTVTDSPVVFNKVVAGVVAVAPWSTALFWSADAV